MSLSSDYHRALRSAQGGLSRLACLDCQSSWSAIMLVVCVADVILSQLVTSAKQPRGSCSTPQTDIMNQLSEGRLDFPSIHNPNKPITACTQSWYTAGPRRPWIATKISLRGVLTQKVVLVSMISWTKYRPFMIWLRIRIFEYQWIFRISKVTSFILRIITLSYS